MLMPNTNLNVAAAAAAAAAAADENFVGSLNSLGVIGTNSIAGTTSSTTNNNNNQQQDTTWTKLFVGGLPYHTTDKSLRDHFAVYGDIEEAVVITDRSTGKSRGYGFVTMTDRSAAERACKEPNPMIDGRKANVNLAILGAKPRTSLPTAFPFSGIRAGFPTLLASQYGIPSAGYVYQMPYLTTAAASPTNLVQYPATTLQQAAAVAAATSQFYEYQNAAATAAAVAAAASYPTNYAAAAAAAVNGFEAFPYATIAGTSGYMNPYTYATNLPQATSIANAAAAAAATNSAFTTLPSYQSAAAAAAAAVQPSGLQESHMQ